MKSDALAPLLKVRGLQVAAARRDLADRLAGELFAGQQASAAAAALAAELRHDAGVFADSLAAWLPRARSLRDRTAGDAALAAEAADSARQTLAEIRAQERAVELICERRAAEARQEALRRGQAALDEAAQRAR